MVAQATTASLSSSHTVSAKDSTSPIAQELLKMRTAGGSVASLLDKFNMVKDGRPDTTSKNTPRPSPSITTIAKATKTLSGSATAVSLQRQSGTYPVKQTRHIYNPTKVEALEQELIALYQEALDRRDVVEQQLKSLESDIETYSSNSTKVRDYEIRVEYLAQKVEQLLEERDALERELTVYREKHGDLDTPVSPIFHHRLSDIFDTKDGNSEHGERQSANDEILHGILDAYEEGNKSETASEKSLTPNEHYENQIAYLMQQLDAFERGTKLAMQQYISDLEKERLETKALKEVIRKQDDLIARLESGNSVDHDASQYTSLPQGKSLTTSIQHPTVKDTQISLQPARCVSPELHNAVDVSKQGSSTRSTSKSPHRTNLVPTWQQPSNTIDILAEIARPGSPFTASEAAAIAASHRLLERPDSQSSMNSMKKTTGPPSPPPRQPLPPVPTKSFSKSSANSLYSQRESVISSVTSLSTNGEEVNAYDNMYANYMVSEDSVVLEHHSTALGRLEQTPSVAMDADPKSVDKPYSMWNGWKSKLSSQS